MRLTNLSQKTGLAVVLAALLMLAGCASMHSGGGGEDGDYENGEPMKQDPEGDLDEG